MKYGKIKLIKEIEYLSNDPSNKQKFEKAVQLSVTKMLEKIPKGKTMSGYFVSTDKAKVLVLIDDYCQCCEDYGYFTSDDDISSFIGAELLGIKMTDTALNEIRVKDMTDYCKEEPSIQFIDFETNKGVLQLAVYNAHNGAYGHDVLVLVNEKIFEDGYL